MLIFWILMCALRYGIYMKHCIKLHSDFPIMLVDVHTWEIAHRFLEQVSCAFLLRCILTFQMLINQETDYIFWIWNQFEISLVKTNWYFTVLQHTSISSHFIIDLIKWNVLSQIYCCNKWVFVDIWSNKAKC